MYSPFAADELQYMELILDETCDEFIANNPFEVVGVMSEELSDGERKKMGRPGEKEKLSRDKGLLLRNYIKK